MTTPADELRTAAFLLRNPLHQRRGLAIGTDAELRLPLADWLDQTADLHESLPALTATDRALEVARAVNGGEPS
jgi:hypothetical protein